MTYDKRSLELLVLMVVGSALITPVSIVIGSVEQISWKTFNDSEGLFTIEYPSKWNPMNTTHPLGPIDVEFWYNGTNESYAWVGAYAAPDSPYPSTREMINNEQARAESAGAKLEQSIECSKYFINDILACSMIYSGLNPDLIFHPMTFPASFQGKVLFVYLVDNKGIEYTLYLGATPDLFEYFKPVFDHMVGSFTLKGIR